MVKLIVVRHGETIENTMGICQGQTHGTLSDKGRSENKLLAKELSFTHIDKLYSSPLKRAYETAREILKYHNVDLELRDHLYEWFLGDLQGKEFPEDFNISMLGDHVDNVSSVKERLHILLKEISDQYQNKTVLLVSHGLTIKVLISIINNIPEKNVNDIELMKNSDYRRFIIK